MITLGDVYAARRRMGKWVRRTPSEPSSLLSGLTNAEVWLKLENRQLTGSFKLRGATNRIALLTPEERKKGVVAASSGNHARAHMEAERLAQQISRENGMPFLSPYNDPDLIAGQGTVALEMVEDCPELDAVLVPVSGGGLISGVAIVMKGTSKAEVVGVQTEASPVMHESIKAGKIVDIPMFETVAEGLHGGIEQGSVTFPICQRLVNDWIDVKENTIIDALRLMLFRQHEIMEGSGAVGVAALLESPHRFEGKRVGVIITGGNIDEELLRRVASR